MKNLTTFFKSLTISTLLVLSGIAMAQSGPNPLNFKDPWLRGSAPGQKNGAGYVTIHNTGAKPLALLSVDSDRADRIELHTVTRTDGVAKMREVEKINIPAASLVKLEPGGYHIMFIGLRAPFEPGQDVALTLNFEGNHQDTVTFKVMPPTFMGTGHKMMKGH